MRVLPFSEEKLVFIFHYTAWLFKSNTRSLTPIRPLKKTRAYYGVRDDGFIKIEAKKYVAAPVGFPESPSKHRKLPEPRFTNQNFYCAIITATGDACAMIGPL